MCVGWGGSEVCLARGFQRRCPDWGGVRVRVRGWGGGGGGGGGGEGCPEGGGARVESDGVS